MKKIFFLWFFFVASSSQLFAAGETGAEFLKLGVGARALGMGGAYSAIANDASASYWNPAGLTLIRKQEMLLMHDEYLLNFNYDYLGYTFPIGSRISLGSELHYLYVNDIRAYDHEGNKGGKLSAYDGMFSASCGLIYMSNQKRFLSFGSTLKIIQQKLVDERAQALGMDMGILYKSLKKNISAAFTARHIGITKLKFISESAPLPLEYRIGLAYNFFIKNIGILLSSDMVKPLKEITYLVMGGEMNIWNFLSFRSGLCFGRDEGSGLSYGIGFKGKTMRLDYAMLPYGDLGDTHKISVGYIFGGFTKDEITIRNEERASFHYERAIKFMEDGDSIKAAYELESCLKFYPDYRDAQQLLDSKIRYFYSRGVEAYEEGKMNEALSWLNLAVKYGPRHEDSWKLMKKIEQLPKDK